MCRVDGVTTTTTVILSLPTVSTDEDGLSTLVYDAPILSSRRGGHFFFGSSANTTTGNEEVTTDVLLCDAGGVVSLFIDGWGSSIGTILGVGAATVLCPECTAIGAVVAGTAGGQIGGAIGQQAEDDANDSGGTVTIQYPSPPPPYGYRSCGVPGLIEDPHLSSPGGQLGSPTCWKPDAAPACPEKWDTKVLNNWVPFCLQESGAAYTTCPAGTVEDPFVTPVGLPAKTPLCIIPQIQGSDAGCPSGWKPGTESEFPTDKIYCVPQ